MPPESPGETLARLQQELRQLRVRYTDKHPDVVRVMLAIADLEKELSNSPSPATNTTRDPRSIPLATTNPYLIQLRQRLASGVSHFSAVAFLHQTEITVTGRADRLSRGRRSGGRR